MLNSLFIGNQDGGIISTIIQAPQSSEPMVIIGLGGTGVDAITRLKTKLQRQIEPDNKDDVKKKGAEPKYDHIRFLGIDADEDWLNNSGLSQGESLSIRNTDFKAAFAAAKLPALKNKKELQWMSIDYIANHLPTKSKGAGAYRQFGRWLTIASANKIKTKITEAITQACTGKIGGDLNVHIVSGISGGMGAGSFVDVCYIAREVIDGLGFNDAVVFGYFVLPDAVISKEKIRLDETRTKANQRNGIASLLEIEHLMNLQDSNEWFEQDYGSFKIRTQHPLVDACYLISSTNMDGVLVDNGYEYALNVIGDYILAFVSEEQVADGKDPITMSGNITNINSHITDIIPEYGYSQNYHIIGSANAEIPTTQMATYLAGELFKKLTIRRKMPDNNQIEQEFADYLKLSDSRFKQLENQVAQGPGWIQISEQQVKQYFDQIRAHMNERWLPGALVNPTESSLKQRKGLLTQKRESLEKDVSDYIYQTGASSIPGMALNKLIQIAEDPAKGPIYAYGMMNKTGADIFHYLDGRLKYYSDQKLNAKDQEATFYDQEPSIRIDMCNSNMFNKGARIRTYTTLLNSMYEWQAKAELYEEMEILMSDLITSFRAINNRYLKPLYQVTIDLIETFDANSTYFEMGKGNQSQDGFTKQLVPFSSIKPELDSEIVKLDSITETAGLLKVLTTYPDTWMEREELKLKARISEYILDKFKPILSGSLEEFLRKDMGMLGVNEEVFAKAIRNKIINPFVDAAAPIFWTNERQMIGNDQKTTHTSILTVPNAANCICMAAEDNQQAEVRKSLINDRIYVLRTISGVPMHGYQGLIQYLGAYTNYADLGLHMYERNVNWRDILTFPYPYSYVPDYTKNAEDLLKLYADAVEKGIIYFQSGNAYVKQFGEVGEELLNLEGLQTNGKMDMELAKRRIAVLEEMLNTSVNSLPINSKGNQAGNSIVKDNFLRFYGVQQTVRKEIEKFDCMNKAIADIKETIEDVIRLDILRKAFFAGVLAGMFDDDGLNMSYKYVQLGMEKTAVLCANGMNYAGYSKFYQSFVTMIDLEEAVVEEFIQKANDKFNAMNPKDKLEKIDKLLSIYTPQMLAMISQKYVGDLARADIDAFYSLFVNYMNETRFLLMMSGVVV